VEAILDVYVRGVEIKQILDPNVIMMHLLQKTIHGEMLVLVCIGRTICSIRNHGKKDGWLKFQF
jgi:hypothetical protein